MKAPVYASSTRVGDDKLDLRGLYIAMRVFTQIMKGDLLGIMGQYFKCQASQRGMRNEIPISSPQRLHPKRSTSHLACLEGRQEIEGFFRKTRKLEIKKGREVQVPYFRVYSYYRNS